MFLFAQVNFGLYWGFWDYICGTRFDPNTASRKGQLMEQRYQYEDVYTQYQLVQAMTGESEEPTPVKGVVETGEQWEEDQEEAVAAEAGRRRGRSRSRSITRRRRTGKSVPAS